MKKDTRPSATISTFLKDTIIGMAADELATKHKFPRQTANFSALIIASHIVGSCYSVKIHGHQPLPIPLYGVSEQPSNSSKTSVVEELYSGYIKEAIKINREVQYEREKIKSSMISKQKNGVTIGLDVEQEKLNSLRKIPLGFSDPTPEALESSLIESDGFYIAYSTEQGLSKTLLGGFYSDREKKDDLILKGFNGEYHASARTSRASFAGRPYGGVFELSQEGTIARIMSSAGTTGTAERFLMIIEDNLIGSRRYLPENADLKEILVNGKVDKNLLSKIEKTKTTACEQFKMQSAEFARIRSNLSNVDIDSLPYFYFTDEAMVALLAAKQVMENQTANESIRNSFLASMRGKIDLQIMKVSATIHAMDWHIETHGEISREIGIDTVIMAYNIVDSLFHGIKNVADGNNIYGENAEDIYVLDYIQSNRMPISISKICHNISRKKDSPFRFYTERGEARNMIKKSVDRLVESGQVMMRKGTNPVYSA